MVTDGWCRQQDVLLWMWMDGGAATDGGIGMMDPNNNLQHGGVWSSTVFVVGWMFTFVRDHGHVHGSRRSELTNCLGENPGGTLGTAQANPCCWLTSIGP